MKIMIVDEEYECFISDILKELSKKEHHGVKNMLVVAITGNDEPVLSAMNASDLYSLEAMLSYAMGYFNAKETLMDKALFDSMIEDEIPESED